MSSTPTLFAHAVVTNNHEYDDHGMRVPGEDIYLPYGGDMNKAVQAQDRDAIRELMDHRESAPVVLAEPLCPFGADRRWEITAAAAATKLAAASRRYAMPTNPPWTLKKVRGGSVSKRMLVAWLQTYADNALLMKFKLHPSDGQIEYIVKKNTKLTITKAYAAHLAR